MCFELIDKTIDIIFFSINWKNYFDQSILVLSMTVLVVCHIQVQLHAQDFNFWSSPQHF